MAELDDRAFAGLSRSFVRIGRLGFRVQVLLGLAPILTGLTALVLSDTAGLRFTVLGGLAIASVLVLAFTTLWFRRHVAIGESLDGHSAVSLSRIVWTGLYASSAGIVVSLIVIIAEITCLLVRFREVAQDGVPVRPSSLAASGLVSAIDMFSLLALVLTVAAEIAAFGLGMLLLGQVLLATRLSGAGPDGVAASGCPRSAPARG